MSDPAAPAVEPATFSPDEAATRRIEAETEQAVERHAAWPEHIPERLRQLDREWDADRTLMANAAMVGLAGTLLAALVDRRWLVLPLAASGFLLQHATGGWSYPAQLFRRGGVRRDREIEQERMALKALRGDFERLSGRAGSPRERAAETVRAARMA